MSDTENHGGDSEQVDFGYRRIEAGAKTQLVRGLFDRDSAPGAEAEQLLAMDIPAIIVPGADDAHATSAAMYLHECLVGSEYVDIPPKEQSEENIPGRVLDFLDRLHG